VIVHDGNLARVTGAAVKVTSATLAEVQAQPLLGGDEPVPTLADALAVLGDTPTMVEIKSLRFGSGRIEAIAADLLDGHGGPWCVASFNPASIRWFRRHRPAVPRILTSCPPDGFAPPGSWRFDRQHSQKQSTRLIPPFAIFVQGFGARSAPANLPCQHLLELSRAR
jgi:hypothetical protein